MQANGFATGVSELLGQPLGATLPSPAVQRALVGLYRSVYAQRLGDLKAAMILVDLAHHGFRSLAAVITMVRRSQTVDPSPAVRLAHNGMHWLYFFTAMLEIQVAAAQGKALREKVFDAMVTQPLLAASSYCLMACELNPACHSAHADPDSRCDHAGRVVAASLLVARWSVLSPTRSPTTRPLLPDADADAPAELH